MCQEATTYSVSKGNGKAKKDKEQRMDDKEPRRRLYSQCYSVIKTHSSKECIRPNWDEVQCPAPPPLLSSALGGSLSTISVSVMPVGVSQSSLLASV